MKWNNPDECAESSLQLGRVFSKMRPIFEKDEETGEFVLTGEEDIDELIQSNFHCTADAVLNRFLETGVIEGAQPVEMNQDFLNDKLDIAMERAQIVQDAIKEYDLPDEATAEEVKQVLYQKYLEERSKNEAQNKTEQAQEQETVQSLGEENAR